MGINAAEEIKRLIASEERTLGFQIEARDMSEREYLEERARVAQTEDKIRALKSALEHLVGGAA